MAHSGIKTSVLALSVIASAFLNSGCHSIKVTEPARTATEQLLLSTATDHAVQDIDLSVLNGRKVFFDPSFFESYDDGYAIGSIRELISKSGALMVAERKDSEVVVEARSGALGIDSRDSLFGLPELTVPVPLAGQVNSPEISLYKAEHADAIAKFALLAYETVPGTFVHSTGSMVGKAKFHHYKILGFINWRSTDIPEQKPGN